MDGIIGEQRKQALIPTFTSLLSLIIGVAVCWNALNGQLTGQSPFARIGQDLSLTGSIGDLVERIGVARDRSANADEKHDPEIVQIQQALRQKGLYAGKINGLVGTATRQAMAAYCEKHAIIACKNEKQAILEHIRSAKQIGAATNHSALQTSVISKKTIRLIQIGLSELGYDPGPVDGSVGERTKDAVRDFQRDRSLKPTGSISRELLSELRKVTGLTSLGES